MAKTDMTMTVNVHQDLVPDEVERIFTYAETFPDQADRFIRIREAAKILANVIVESTPQCADQAAAIRKLRECVMTANAAIALEERD